MSQAKLGKLRNRFGVLLSELGCTVYEVSVKSGIAESTLHEFANNPEHLGKTKTLAKIAETLNVKFFDLLEGDLVSCCQCTENDPF